MSNSIQVKSVTHIDTKKIPFTKYDVGWVILCIGMAIGSGIVFMPVQIGIKGIWVFIAATIISYPAIYWLQNLYLRTLSESEECNDYASVITQYLGKNWGVVLGIAYFLMLLHGMFSYSLAVTFDSASYIKTFGLTEGLLSDSIWYGLIIISVLVAIAAQGERLLFKVSGPMVIVKFGIIVLLGVVMVPYWNFANITAFPDFLPFIRDVFLTLPFTLFSILFVQILSPMNIAYRKIESDKRVAIQGQLTLCEPSVAYQSQRTDALQIWSEAYYQLTEAERNKIVKYILRYGLSSLLAQIDEEDKGEK